MARGKNPTHKLRLTELTVRKAKAQSKPYVIWDGVQRGLALRVQPTGAKSWVTVYSRQGRSRWLTIGNADAVHLADARQLAAEVMVEVARGKDPAAEKRAERGAGTFAELAARYVEQYARRHNKSWKQAAYLVRRNLLPRWGKLQASSISRADVKAMMARIEAPVLANQCLAAASAVFGWAVKEEILAANPCAKVDRNPTKSRERILSDSEVPRFWAEFSPALKVLLLTGQRPGEVSHMRREHIKDGWWEMPGAPAPALKWPGTKNATNHRIWLPKAVQVLIAEGDSGFVFAGRRNLDAMMRAICSKLGVERVTPHDLRRTHGSTITRLGFGRAALNRVQNHREGGIADVYDRHQYQVENQKIMQAVANHIVGLVDGRGTGKVVQLPVTKR